MKNKKPHPYDELKRPTVPLTKEEHKHIARHCLENDMRIGDFLRRAGLYCVEKNIKFKDDK